MRKSTLSVIIAAALGSVIASSANAFVLTDGTAVVEGDRLGLSSWSQNGVNHLYEQTWWFNASTAVGSTPYNYELVDYDATPTEDILSGTDARLSYNILGLDVSIDYSLSGGVAQSSLSEDILVHNGTGSIASFTLFQYTDFDLNGSPAYDSSANDVGNGTDNLNYGQNDTIEQLFDNTVRQTNGTMTAMELGTVAPLPTVASIGQAVALTDDLFDGTVTATANGSSFTGDAAWIWAFTFDIAAGEDFSISKSLKLEANPPAVPVPAAVWLFASGLLGLVGVARRST